MHDAPFTTPPIVAKQRTAGGFKRMLFGHAASDAYYEALDPEGRYLLWMEFSRFGSLRAYPCVLKDAAETLVYRPYGDLDSGAALLERWQALVTEDAVHALQITELTKADFQRIYRSYRSDPAQD